MGEAERIPGQVHNAGSLPLHGRRIAITRTREQAGILREQLGALGAEVIEVPTIEIRDPISWETLDAAIRRLEDFDYLLLTSVNGVGRFLARLRASGREARDLNRLVIGAIGPATAAEFGKAGVRVDFVPPQYQAEGLIEALKGHDLRGKAILIPRARLARDLVPRALTDRGARVEVVEAYETAAPACRPEELDRMLTPRPDLVTFTSSSTALNFARMLGDRKISEFLAGVAVASIGPITSGTVRRLGLEVTVEAEQSTIPSLVHAIKKLFTK